MDRDQGICAVLRGRHRGEIFQRAFFSEHMSGNFSRPSFSDDIDHYRNVLNRTQSAIFEIKATLAGIVSR